MRNFALISIVLAFAAQGGRGVAAEPFGLPPERVAPTEPGPSLPPTKGAVTVLLHAMVKQKPVVELRVPEEYLHSRRPVFDQFGVFFFATYPDLRGPWAPGNEGLVGCRGYCNGRMLIFIDNASGFISQDPAHYATNERKLLGPRVSAPTERFGLFDEVSAGQLPGSKTRSVLYVRHDRSGAVVGYARCGPDDPVPGCEEMMTLPGHPELRVKYDFSMRDLPHWLIVREGVAHLVGSFYVATLPPSS